MSVPRDITDALTAPVKAPCIRLLILADVRLYREGMSQSLASKSGIAVTGAASNLDEAIDQARATSPDVIIVDMATRDSLSAVRALQKHLPAIRVIGFGVEEVEGDILACAEAGFAGYVPCDASLDELVLRVESVCRGELLCPPRIAASLFRQLAAPQKMSAPQSYRAASPDAVVLTGRQRDVLALIDAGLSNKEIACRLSIEVSTVKNHVHCVLDKLNVTSRAQAAAHLGTHLTTRDRRVRITRQGEHGSRSRI
jgi:two-component system, NarL family, nitrate/nitrite response regulator NarL